MSDRGEYVLARKAIESLQGDPELLFGASQMVGWRGLVLGASCRCPNQSCLARGRVGDGVSESMTLGEGVRLELEACG